MFWFEFHCFPASIDCPFRDLGSLPAFHTSRTRCLPKLAELIQVALFCHDDGGQTLRLLEKLLRFFAEKYGGDDCEAHPSSHPCRKGALDWAAHLGRSLNHRCRRARPRVELASAPTAWDPLAGFYPRARVRWRRRRYPFLARRRWSGWPLRISARHAGGRGVSSGA